MSSNKKKEKSIRNLIRLTKKELKDLRIHDLLADPKLKEAFRRAKPKRWSELTEDERKAQAKEQAEAEQEFVREQKILRVKELFQSIMKAKCDEPNSKLFTTAEELLEFVVKYESSPSSVSNYEWNRFETILLTRLESLLQADGKEEEPTETDQGSLQEIIEVLKNWQESKKTVKDFEAAKSALPPVAKTYDILCRTKGQCGAKTTDIIRWLGTAARDNSGYYRALFADFASPEVIADLEQWQEQSAETGQGNKDAKSEGEGGFIDNTKPTIKKLLSKNFIKATIKHFPYCGSYLFDIIYGVDGMKEQKEKTDLSIIARDNIDRTTPEPEKEKVGWERVKKISLILGIIVSLVVIFGAYNKYIRKNKPAIERIETPKTETKQIAENKLDLSLRNICRDIDSRPLALQAETEKQYLGLRIKRERLKVLEVEINPGDESIYNLGLTIPDQPNFPNSKWIILCTVSKDQYPQLRGAREGMEFYLSGEIETTFRRDRVPYICLSNVTLEFE